MKTVLITGANGGLGSYLSHTLLEQGYFVVLNYHVHNDNLLPLLQEYPNQTFLLQGDVSLLNDVEKMKEECDELSIKIDILINNAAIDHVSEVNEKTCETFLNVFSINTLSVFLMSKIFGSEINERGGGIINITSDNTIDSYDPVTMEYDVSKAGVNMLTYNFAKYYKNAKINAIAFGWLDTSQNVIPNDMKQFISFVPMEKAVATIIQMFDTNKTGEVILCR